MKRTICRRCGNWFTTKGENTMCQYCIATTLEEINPIPKPKKKKESQLVKDARDAKEHDMSYGEWMTSKERGMRK